MRAARPLVLLAALAVTAGVVSACAEEHTPGWTFAPTPTPAVPPPAEATPTPAPDGEATPPPAAGTVLHVSAQGIAFDTEALTAPADTPFQIVFANNDAGIPHNVEILQDGRSVWKGELFNGVETRTYDVPALPAGSYEFICTVHPNMRGILTVE
jgi:plastocyanin